MADVDSDRAGHRRLSGEMTGRATETQNALGTIPYTYRNASIEGLILDCQPFTSYLSTLASFMAIKNRVPYNTAFKALQTYFNPVGKSIREL